MKGLHSRRARLVREIQRGKADATLIFACWLMNLIAPEISGNYYVFAKAGRFPRRGADENGGYSRRALRNRMKWAKGKAIETIPRKKMMFVNRHGDVDPDNAAPDPRVRLDIPIVAWNNIALIPFDWRALAKKISAERTYRLDRDFAENTLPGLIVLGKVVREGLRDEGGKLDDYLEQRTREIWGNLRVSLTKQHPDTTRHYAGRLDALESALQGNLKDEAEAAFLAFSIVDFRRGEYPLKPVRLG